MSYLQEKIDALIIFFGIKYIKLRHVRSRRYYVLYNYLFATVNFNKFWYEFYGNVASPVFIKVSVVIPSNWAISILIYILILCYKQSLYERNCYTSITKILSVDPSNLFRIRTFINYTSTLLLTHNNATSQRVVNKDVNK